jgi:PAS domain S-box-containing protein
VGWSQLYGIPMSRGHDPHADWWEPLVQVSLDGQFVLRPVDSELTDFEVLYANPPGAAFGGFTPSQVIGKRLSDVAPAFGSGLRDALVSSFRDGVPVHRVTDRIAPGVNTRRAEFKVQPFGGCLALSVIDRTDEYDAEAEAQRLRELLSIGVLNSPTAFALLRPIVDETGTVIDVSIEQANETAAALVGLDPSQIVGKPLYSLVDHPQRLLADLVNKSYKSRQMVSEDVDTRGIAEGADWLRVQLTPVGEFVVMHAEDISPQRREEAILRNIVQHASELIIYSGADGNIEYVNPFTVASLGYSEGSLLHSSIAAVTHPDDRASVIDEFYAMHEPNAIPRRRQLRIIDAAGGTRTMIGSTMALRAIGGEISGMVTVAADLTERLASEEAREQLAAELSMAEQRERERVAEGLHDGPVQDLTALSMKLGAAINVRSTPELIEAENILVRVISDLRLLMFQLSPPELDGDRLSHAIYQRAEHLFANTGVKISVRGILVPSPPPATAVHFFRLAQEALVNAFKHADARNVSVRIFDSADGSQMVLEIVDDGRGASAEQYRRQAAGHFGISMMSDRARQLGGQCVIEGSVGSGTKIVVQLPRRSVLS